MENRRGVGMLAWERGHIRGVLNEVTHIVRAMLARVDAIHIAQIKGAITYIHDLSDEWGEEAP
jgi:hypothetical protein